MARTEPERVAGGRGAEVDAFCARMRPRLVGALTLYCGERDLAEELAQETLARVYSRWESVRAADSPDAYTHRVALNLANSTFRRRGAERRARRRLEASAVERVHDTDEADALALREAVSRLPRGQRTALVLRYFADLSVADTAALMGCSQGTVKSQTAHAIGALRRHAGLGEPTEVHQ